MKKFLIISGIAAAALFASCSKQESPIALKASFTAGVEQTKTQLDEDGFSVIWSEGDKINVFGGGQNKEYTAEAGGAFTTFTGDAIDATEFYGIYPYNSGNKIDGSVISATVPVEQAPVSGSFAKDAGLLVAHTTGTTFEFKHVLGYIKVIVAGEGITSVTVTSADGSALAGTVNIDWNGGVPSVTVKNPIDHVSLVAGAGSSIAPGTYYLAAAPFTSAAGLKVRYNKSSLQTAQVKSSASATVARAGILDIKTPEQGIASYVNRIDLSAEGTSNSYIVTGAGQYRFKDSKGNSTDVSGASVADWMWADKTGLISNVLYEPDGYITFTASALKGNSVIAGLRSAGNATILWSWHIWLTDDPTVNSCYGLDTSFQIMDRNLGATSTDVDNVDSYGLYYEFARKDPFPGANTIGSKTAGYAEGTAFTTASRFVYNPRFHTDSGDLNGASSYFRVKANNSGEVVRGNEISKLIARPMTYISYGAGSYCWLYLPDQTGTEVSEAYQNEIAALWGNNTTTKGIYDPCPRGWKVMRADKLANTTAGTAWTDLFTVVSSSTNGLRYTSPQNTTTTFPAAGYRAANKNARLANVGSQSVNWTACSRIKAGQGDVAWISNPTESKQQSVYTTQAYPVRCQKIDE